MTTIQGARNPVDLWELAVEHDEKIRESSKYKENDFKFTF